jgi:branched-chain amino acid:cation transporter, LIVCS family
MFAMFFGAGNVVFPLLLGQEMGTQTVWAMSGLLLTAVVMPFVGLVTVVLYDSDHKVFFGRIGKLPGYLLAAAILFLIGPFGGIPRTIALSYSTLALSLPGLPLGVYSLLACLVIFLFAWKESRVIDLIGYILTPLLLISLVTIIVIGLIHPPVAVPHNGGAVQAFIHGLAEGYNTLDLLAACFFSSVILIALRKAFPEKGTARRRALLRASVLGAVLLSLVYLGLSFVSSYYREPMLGVPDEQLLGAIALHLAGPVAGLVANIAIVLACLTTAISLAAVFADVLHEEIFREKLAYVPALILTLVVSYFVSYLNFTGIKNAIAPVVLVSYPALIVLTLLNLAYKLWGFRPVKAPVYIVFGITLVTYLVLR